MSEQLLGSCRGYSPLCVSLTFVRQGLCFRDGSLVLPFVLVTNVLLFVLSLPLLFVEVEPSYQWGAAGRAPQAEPSVSSSRTSSHWK